MSNEKYSYPTYAKIIHLGIVLFGISAFLSGDLSEDGVNSLGYLIHSCLGLSLALIMAIRISIGFTTAEALSFKRWSLFSKQQWKLALEDINTLLKFKTPERDRHQGMSGITQAFGLLIFTWMSLTGITIFILGLGEEGEAFKFVAEIHDVGEILIILYLLLHVGAVLLHTVCGNPIWKKMFNFKSS